jgi:hypothetical protein
MKLKKWEEELKIDRKRDDNCKIPGGYVDYCNKHTFSVEMRQVYLFYLPGVDIGGGNDMASQSSSQNR